MYTVGVFNELRDREIQVYNDIKKETNEDAKLILFEKYGRVRIESGREHSFWMIEQMYKNHFEKTAKNLDDPEVRLCFGFGFNFWDFGKQIE